MKVRFFYLAICSLALNILGGCAGYHFNTNNNPLIGYGIRTVAVPMFVNRSVIPQIAAPLTAEIFRTLSEYSGLKVISGDDETADAVLLGIIDSKDHYNDVVKTSASVITEGAIGTLIGPRLPFYYPTKTTYQLSFRYILIKRPTKQELELLRSDLGSKMILHPKIVLSDELPITGTFDRVIGTTASSTETNFVKNKGVFEKNIKDTCVSVASSFKQVVLNAF